MDRRIRFVLALLTIFPLVSGILGLMGIDNPIYSPSSDLILDSNLRFLNGMSVGVAVSVYLILPRIRKETTAFRILMGAIICGGAGRALSLLVCSYVSFPVLIVVLAELISPAVLVYYQSKIKD